MKNIYNIFKYWLTFSFGAEDVNIKDNVCTFLYKGERRRMPLQVIDQDTTGFIYNKETFDNRITGQITNDYIAVIDATNAKKVLSNYKDYIVKTESGYMEVPLLMAQQAVKLVRLESI